MLILFEQPQFEYSVKKVRIGKPLSNLQGPFKIQAWANWEDMNWGDLVRAND